MAKSPTRERYGKPEKEAGGKFWSGFMSPMNVANPLSDDVGPEPYEPFHNYGRDPLGLIPSNKKDRRG